MSELVWKGKRLEKMGEISDVVAAIAKLPDDQARLEAAAFMKIYAADTPHAFENIGYLAGYFDAATARRIWDLFETSHPIFGRTIPTVEEALAAGAKLAKETKL